MENAKNKSNIADCVRKIDTSIATQRMDMSRAAAVVLAAGKGKRMGTATAKQFLDLCGKPVLCYSLEAFVRAGVGSIVLVVGEDMVEYCRNEIVERFCIPRVKAVVPGGKERYHSVYQGLLAVQEADVVMIHDGARPFITPELIQEVYRNTVDTGTCVVGVPVKDTIKVVNAQGIATATPDRSTLWQIQTPQSFLYSEILQAYSDMLRAGDDTVTDDAMVMERYGSRKVCIRRGDYRNIKLTTPEDMLVATAYAQSN